MDDTEQLAAKFLAMLHMRGGLASLTQWIFKELSSGFVDKTSHEEEFFTNTPKVEALVREAVQNSMDASLGNGHCVRVRFTRSRVAGGEVQFLFEGLSDHLKASDIQTVSLGKIGFPFLAVEDFETTGLGGDVDPPGKSTVLGDFYNFWWSDGSMRKRGKSGGRWGLGKYSFFGASKLKSFWGVTARSEDKRVFLMGRSLLKSHSINGIRYNIDGFYSKDDFYPISDTDVIRKFSDLFLLSRKGESGLSIVLPYPISDVYEDGIEEAVLDHCLYPILSGKLEVELQSGSNRDSISLVRLNKNSLAEFVKNRIADDKSYAEYERQIRFFQACILTPPDAILEIDDPAKPEITETSFSQSLDEIRKKYSRTASGSFVKVRVPIRITAANGSSSDSYFDVAFYRDKEIEGTRAFSFRSGISVIEGTIYSPRLGYAALIAEHGAVAEFLGDAENPSHTEWKYNTENFSTKYDNSRTLLRFVKESIRQIANVLDKSPETVERDLLSDIFYVADREAKGSKRKVDGDGPKVKKQQSLLNIERTSGGFTLRINTPAIGKGTTFPQFYRAKVAYLLRRGNSFTKYERSDFDLSRPPISISRPVGGTIISASLNELQFTVESSDFTVKLTGFDPNRDLVVKALKSGGTQQ